MYDFKIESVYRVVDGDTVDLVIDVGFYLRATMRFRVLGIDSPERGQEGWREANEFAALWLEAHAPYLRIQTHKADSFGRWLGVIYDGRDPSNSLAQAMIDSGHAKVYGR